MKNNNQEMKRLDQIIGDIEGQRPLADILEEIKNKPTPKKEESKSKKLTEKIAIAIIGGLAGLTAIFGLGSYISNQYSATPQVVTKTPIEETQPKPSFTAEQEILPSLTPQSQQLSLATQEPVLDESSESVSQEDFSSVNWLTERIGQSTIESEHVSAGRFFYISAGFFKIGDLQCYAHEGQVCVYITQPSQDKEIIIEGLDPGASWIAISEANSAMQVLEDRSPFFWTQDNCDINGCDYARVFIDKENCVEKLLVYPEFQLEYLERCETGSSFVPISLKSYSEISSPETNLGMEPGFHNIQGIDFENGWRISTKCNDNLYKDVYDSYNISAGVENVKSVYFLIQAGWAFNEDMDKHIGSIQLDFADGSKLVEELILGNNIRDWTRDKSISATTVSADNIFEAWRGTAHGYTGGVDILRLDIPNSMQKGYLDNILIQDLTQENLENIDPCIYVLGITLETQ